MEPEDLEPRHKPVSLRNLEPMGIEELEAYIGDLETEIERVRAEIARKQAHRSGAEAFFKK